MAGLEALRGKPAQVSGSMLSFKDKVKEMNNAQKNVGTGEENSTYGKKVQEMRKTKAKGLLGAG